MHCKETFYEVPSEVACAPCPGPENDILLGILFLSGLCYVVYFLHGLFQSSELDRDLFYQQQKNEKSAQQENNEKEKERSVEMSSYGDSIKRKWTTERQAGITRSMTTVSVSSLSSSTFSTIGRTASVIFSHCVLLNFALPHFPLFHLPHWFSNALKVLVNLVTVDMIKLASSPDCQFRLTFSEKYSLTACLPVFAALMAAIWWGSARCIANHRANQQAPFDGRSIFATVFLISLSFLFPIMFHRIIVPWDCTTSKGEVSVWDVDPNVTCTLEDLQWGPLFWGSIFLFLLYIVLPALVFFRRILGWKLRRGQSCRPSFPIPDWLDDQNCPNYKESQPWPCNEVDCDECTKRKVFGHTFDKFRREHFAWEFAILARKLFVAGTTLFMSNRYDLRLPAEILCNSLYIVCLVRYLPYLSDHEIEKRRTSLGRYEDADRPAGTRFGSCCAAMKGAMAVKSLDEFNQAFDRHIGINNLLDLLLTIGQICLGVSTLGTLSIAEEVRSLGLNQRTVHSVTVINGTKFNTSAIEYDEIGASVLEGHAPARYTVFGMFEWIGCISLLGGTIYFLHLMRSVLRQKVIKLARKGKLERKVHPAEEGGA